jgi:hypothetical protein
MDKQTIIAQAIDHAARGVFDNSICKSGLQRNIYAEAWEAVAKQLKTQNV